MSKILLTIREDAPLFLSVLKHNRIFAEHRLLCRQITGMIDTNQKKIFEYFQAQTPPALKAYYEKHRELRPDIPNYCSPPLRDLLLRMLTRNAKDRIAFGEVVFISMLLLSMIHSCITVNKTVKKGLKKCTVVFNCLEFHPEFCIFCEIRIMNLQRTSSPIPSSILPRPPRPRRRSWTPRPRPFPRGDLVREINQFAILKNQFVMRGSRRTVILLQKIQQLFQNLRKCVNPKMRNFFKTAGKTWKRTSFTSTLEVGRQNL